MLSAIGLGPTNPAEPSGVVSTPGVSTTTLPAVNFGSTPIPAAQATLATGQTGIYQVTFEVPTNAAAGSYPVSISIGGATSNSVSLYVGQPPAGPVIASVVDAVTLTTALCPGGLAIVSGANLGGNSTVTVGGEAAYNFPSGNGYQMTIEIPVDASPGSVNVTVSTAAGQVSPPFPVTLAQTAPVLYSVSGGGKFAPVHINTGAAVTTANPALPNEQIGVFAIGLGATLPTVPTGTPAPTGVSTASAVQVYLNSQIAIAQVTATLAVGQIGIYEVVFTMPSSPASGNPFLWLGVGTNSNAVPLPVALSTSPPSIDHLSNNYSYILPGMPNYGIAQGSIFAIFGSHLANTQTNLQSPPLGVSLGNVTVTVTVNGATTQAILYYVTPNQIGAILPSATPVGDGTITVNDGLGSGSAPIHVVQSAFGILTLNGVGTGAAAAFDVNNQYLGFTNALNPGDYFVLWGTGVGPVTGDETVAQTPVNLTNIPFSIAVGGIEAQLVYRGRSQYPGLDQVIGIVPADVQPGCWVSVVTISGTKVSNFATLPVASSGRTCSDAALGLGTADVQNLMSKGTFRLALLDVIKSGDTHYNIAGNVTVFYAALADFLAVTPSAFATAALGPSIGSCTVLVNSNAPTTAGLLASTPLDAGSGITVAVANASATLPYQNNLALSGIGAEGIFGDLFLSSEIVYNSSAGPYTGVTGAYTGPLGDGTSTSNFAGVDTGGTFTVSNGSGGADIGPFQTGVTLAGTSALWPLWHTLNTSTIALSTGLTVTWTGGDANSFVEITGQSYGSAAQATAMFNCAVPAAAGQFAIPQSVLLSLPASLTSFQNPLLVPLLQVAQWSLPQRVTIPGIDFATIQAGAQITIVLFYE